MWTYWLVGQLDLPLVEATPTQRKLDGDKARRIIEAMRASVGLRGAAGSTFDHVASEAGVSRGLLHYYFGSKEQLLAEVVRRDCEIRMATLEEGLAGADSADAIVRVLVTHLEAFLDHDPGSYALIFEMFTASRHHEEIQAEMAELLRRVRLQVAGVLEEKQRQGVIALRGDAEDVASVFFALGDGMALQVLSDPEWVSSGAFQAGIRTARFLLGETE